MKLQHQSKNNRFILCCIFLTTFISCSKTNEIVEKNEDQKNISLRSSKPNIILFMADDVGYDVPEFTGGKSYNTPSLNFMAANGMQFTQCFSHPDGFPSRLAHLTGKYNFRNYKSWGQLPKDELTVANMLKDNGYKNCFVGKWQNNGGDERILSAGFEKYQVFLPFSGDQRIRRYKSPLIYQDGDFLPDSVTYNRYSEDMFFEYASNFIDDNKNNPFYLQYSFNLIAQPYVPSPDHPDYANWNPDNDRTAQDTGYVKSMVEYMDKIIGKMIQKVKDEGLLSNTLILFIADNATQELIYSKWRNQIIQGTKTQTSRPGVTTPLVAYWPGTIAPKVTNNELIDYTDFFKTFADAAGVSDLSAYGIQDGVSFYDDLTKTKGPDRDWVFCYWKNSEAKPEIRFINNNEYKLYDENNQDKNFFNTRSDIWELNPIPDASMTAEQRVIKNSLQVQLDLLQD